MHSGATANDPAWKAKEHADEARYAREKAIAFSRTAHYQTEQEQLAAIRRDQDAKDASKAVSAESDTKHPMDRDFEGGFGGQEDLEDRYATTSGEH
ncbi:hypothetical protein D9619_005868 [Psilocybe cf. subviscida]|uniref:Uncharacterized protein n=1 Tax=Psilocybe cf. subviscida TaxID=2480587 RepID=A0A8H5BWJ1_9AGAR|nr:hypothetical protein D9619_005868 [Psilocybe cf. subviscida]